MTPAVAAAVAASPYDAAVSFAASQKVTFAEEHIAYMFALFFPCSVLFSRHLAQQSCI